MNRMWLKLTEISTFENGGFSIVCEKCQVGVVTVGGGWVISTSGFLFPVGHDLYRSTCHCDFFWKRPLPVGWVFENRPDACLHVFWPFCALELGKGDSSVLGPLYQSIPITQSVADRNMYTFLHFFFGFPYFHRGGSSIPLEFEFTTQGEFPVDSMENITVITEH